MKSTVFELEKQKTSEVCQCPRKRFLKLERQYATEQSPQVRKKWEEREIMKGFKARAAERRQTTALVEYFPRSLTDVGGSS